MRNAILDQLKKTSFLDLFFSQIIKHRFIAVTSILMLFSVTNAFSQESRERETILEKNVFLQSLSSGQSRSVSPYNHVTSLLNNINSSIYLINGEVKIYGDVPTCMYVDIPSMPLASNPDLAVDQIEIVTIKISKPSELNVPIDLSFICNYKKIKYIYIKLNFDIKSEKSIKVIKNCNPKCVIFYSVEKIS